MDMFDVLAITVVCCAVVTIVQNIFRRKNLNATLWAFYCAIWVIIALGQKCVFAQLMQKVSLSSVNATYVLCEDAIIKKEP